MAVSSDTCRSLNSPYVSLLLKFVEPSGLIRQRSFELTIPQFQVCTRKDECCVFGVMYYWFDSEMNFFFLCRTFTSSSRRWQLLWRLYDVAVSLQFTCYQRSFTLVCVCWLSKHVDTNYCKCQLSDLYLNFSPVYCCLFWLYETAVHSIASVLATLSSNECILVPSCSV